MLELVGAEDKAVQLVLLIRRRQLWIRRWPRTERHPNLARRRGSLRPVSRTRGLLRATARAAEVWARDGRVWARDGRVWAPAARGPAVRGSGVRAQEAGAWGWPAGGG
ncbi:hypothetical protein SEVIR_1G175500v4 [Setaria viridis]|uniref:Uncharacterized protein n=1 Tax=Setaria viridis TaxID=4556 RepID=A0A4U6WC10_SETVI|nr:hypothetical protein SEVIR_1G175500v2 [Setaria viridis]